MTVTLPCRVVLVGMMGSGKTTIGTLLAERTGWPYHDNDQLLTAATGLTARQLREVSVEELRAAEAAALRLALAMPAPAVVAAAAGAITDEDLRRRLRREGIVVWLRARAEILAERAAGAAHRPWLDGDAVAWLSETAERRAPLYGDLAAIEADTEAGSPDEIADRIVEQLRAHGCGPAGTGLRGL